MWYFMRTPLVLVCLLLWPVFSAGAEEKYTTKWHTRDLFYYDEKNVVQRLHVAPKIAVRLTVVLSSEERTKFFASFSPVAQSTDPLSSSVFFLEFSKGTSAERIVSMVNEISSSGVAEATPVFLVDNIEALVAGVVVEPKIIISAEAVRERMKKFGQVTVRSIFQEDGNLVVYVDEVKPPLHILMLVNLLHKDAWVKRARPRFRYLHDPIIAELSVSPVSGTVGETRQIILAIRMFDPAIKVDEKDLPKFGEGLFMPLMGEGARATRPAEYLFKVLGSRVRTESRDGRSLTIFYRWSFKQYALGEWTISGQPILYKKDGTHGEIRSNPATVIVVSLIGSLVVNDMPDPRALPLPVEKPEAAVEIQFPPTSVYWYERWIKNLALVSRYLWRIAIVFGIIALVTAFVLLRALVVKMRKARLAIDNFRREVNVLCNEGEVRMSYEKLHDAFSRVLHAAFSKILPPNPTLNQVEVAREARTVLGPVWENVVELFEELNQRHKREFTPNRTVVLRLANYVWVVYLHLEPRIAAEIKGRT